MKKILIYGCYGYTGQLISARAALLGLPVLLSGRNATRVEEVATAHGLPWKAVSLEDAEGLDALLKECGLVLHCAGPFSRTAAPMAEACLRTGAHYLDITGEVAVFEALARQDAAARQAGCMFMPGVGFDVVPTDCMAARLHAQMPDATDLKLVIHSRGGGISHGTASTMAENLGESSVIRRDGRLVPAPLAGEVITVDFGRGPRQAASIPWGDVSTAWHTTGIPNITTFVVQAPKTIRMMRMSRYLGWLLRMGWVRRLVQRRIDQRPAGPDDTAREKGRSYVYGRVRNAEGKVLEDRLECPEGYTLTALAGLHIAQKVMAGHVKPGFQTPAGLYGPTLIDEVIGLDH